MWRGVSLFCRETPSGEAFIIIDVRPVSQPVPAKEYLFVPW